MLDNREIINEAFFKKQSYSDKLKKLLPQYEPEGKSGSTSMQGYNSIAVSNADEVKKRLVSSFGAIVGNNTIKTMANKAIKTFPIIISDNIDPETAVLIKRTTEEQYAQYVELLISNQIIDAGAFVTGDDSTGNVAIQALDKISGADFSKRQGFATKTADGELSLNDIARNDVLFNLIRQESAPFEIDDTFTKALLESAIVMPANKADYLVEYLMEAEIEGVPVHFTDNTKRNGTTANDIDPIIRKDKKDDNVTTLTQAMDDLKNQFKSIQAQPNSKDSVFGRVDPYKSIGFNNEIFLDKKRFNKSMDMSIGALLNENPAIKDRFEKATFLLYSHKITGAEYIAYVTQRLGIPISAEIRKNIIVEYRSSTLVNTEVGVGGLFSKDDLDKIASGRHLDVKAKIEGMKVKDAYVAAGIAAGTGATGALTAAAITGSVLSTPVLLAGIVPALVGSSVYLITRFIRSRKKKDDSSTKIYGWERVESLIEIMDMQRRDVQRAYEMATQLKDQAPANLAAPVDLDNAIKKAKLAFAEETSNLFDVNFDTILTEEVDDRKIKPFLVPMNISESVISETLKDLKDVHDEIMKDDSKEAKEYEADIFQEAVISTTVPIKAMKTYEFDPKRPSETIVAPEFSVRNRRAYGSVEYDTRQIKDRRYNQPLIMKINFRERYSDGSFSDNEMSAVIGILGVVTRVPSEEMEEILRANAEGVTLKGILQGDGKAGQSIVDLFGLAKKSKKKRMESSEVWDNLEKVAKLAIVNKFTGRQNNNISNAHIIFSQKEIDNVRNELNIDYLKDKKLVSQLMKKYSAFTIMVANDIGERLYIYDDLDAISWNLVPYSALRSKDGNDAMTSALMKLSDRR